LCFAKLPIGIFIPGFWFLDCTELFSGFLVVAFSLDQWWLECVCVCVSQTGFAMDFRTAATAKEPLSVATPDMAAYCFDILHSHFTKSTPKQPDAFPNESMCVSWKKVRISHHAHPLFSVI
jgi:hypothetical protein